VALSWVWAVISIMYASTCWSMYGKWFALVSVIVSASIIHQSTRQSSRSHKGIDIGPPSEAIKVQKRLDGDIFTIFFVAFSPAFSDPLQSVELIFPTTTTATTPSDFTNAISSPRLTPIPPALLTPTAPSMTSVYKGNAHLAQVNKGGVGGKGVRKYHKRKEIRNIEATI
jgi:hypothetical protein